MTQDESLRFRPLHDVFLRVREQERSDQIERPLSMPAPLASGWMRKKANSRQCWKRRYFSLYPNFDGGGPTLLYYVNQFVSCSSS